MHILIRTLLAGVVCMSSASLAQSFSIQPQVGWSTQEGLGNLGAGVQVGYTLDPFWEIRGGVLFAVGQGKFACPCGPGVKRRQSLELGLDAIYHLPLNETLHGYAGVGFSGVNSTFTYTNAGNTEASNALSIRTYGIAGVAYPVDSGWSLTAEVQPGMEFWKGQSMFFFRALIGAKFVF